MSQDDSLFPPDWLKDFDGLELEHKRDVSAVLATIDVDGWPHMAFLGPGEILLRDWRHVDLLLWSNSSTTGNVERTRRAILVAAAGGSACEAYLKMRRTGDTRDGLSHFRGELIRMRRHATTYATVTGMIGYRLHDPTAVIARWTAQVARLRRSSPS